ncbi:MAG: hypothetical protein ACI8RZ_002309 [Myxococcota bacterium]|jgi:hypothetical protein
MILDPSRRLLPIAAIAGFLACNDDGLFHITIEETAQTTVQGGSLLEDLLGDLGFEEFVTVDLTASEELRNQGVEPGDIVNVTLTTFDLEVLSPDNGDLSFLDEMAVYVEADGLPRMRVAFLDNFPEGQKYVSFNLDDADLTEYAVSEAMSIDTEVTGRSPASDTTIKAYFVVDVGVTSQGACNQWQASRESSAEE